MISAEVHLIFPELRKQYRSELTSASHVAKVTPNQSKQRKEQRCLRVLKRVFILCIQTSVPTNDAHASRPG